MQSRANQHHHRAEQLIYARNFWTPGGQSPSPICVLAPSSHSIGNFSHSRGEAWQNNLGQV